MQSLSSPCVLPLPIIQNTLPASKNDRVFDLFKQFAMQPIEELLGRCLYNQAIYNQQRTVIGLKHYMETKCGVTYKALMRALFGWQFPHSTQLTVCTFENNNLQNFLQQLQINAEQLQQQHAEFFAYGFELDETEIIEPIRTRRYGGHAFILIQFVEDQHIRYRLYQSYVRQYSLKKFISGKWHELNQHACVEFIQRLACYVRSITWTQEMEAFHKRYFSPLITYAVGSPLEHKIPCTIRWGQSCLKQVEELKAQFDLYRHSLAFPQFIIISETDKRVCELLQHTFMQKVKTDAYSVPCTFFCGYYDGKGHLSSAVIQALLSPDKTDGQTKIKPDLNHGSSS